jgi:hypothetical protein
MSCNRKSTESKVSSVSVKNGSILPIVLSIALPTPENNLLMNPDTIFELSTSLATITSQFALM